MKNYSRIMSSGLGEADPDFDEETESTVAAAYYQMFGDMREPGDLETEVLQHEVFERVFAEEVAAAAVTLGP